MASSRPLSPSETGDNFLLNRFLDSIIMPDIENQDSRSKRPSLRSAKTAPTEDPESAVPLPPPTTPDRGSVSFALLPPPKSPGSAKSGRSVKTTVIYKDSNFTTELEARGVFESEEPPSELDIILNMLKRKSPGLQNLNDEVTETFNQCLTVPGSEPTIQAVIVPNLVHIYGIIRHKTTHAAFQTQFAGECVLPLLHGADDDTSKVAPPWPDLTVGLRRSFFRDYILVLRQLGSIAAPIICAPQILFPCFTLEVKGGSGASDARSQNLNNAAHMLRHLRLLSCRARGEKYTEESFDGVVRVLSATVTQNSVTISSHWTILKSGDVYTCSHLVKSALIEGITNEQWNEISRWLQNAIKYIVEKTRRQVEDNLECIQDSGSSRKRRRS